MPCSAPIAVQLFEQLERRHALAVHRNRHALFESDGHLAGLVGRLRGALGQHPDFVRRGVGRVFERAAFVRDVPDVAVAAVDLGGRSGDRHVVCARVFDGVFARNDVPFAPRRDHRQLRRQRLVGELEAHLVVALAGAAVGQRVAAGGQRHFHLLLGQQRPCDGCAQQVLVLVDAAGAHQLPEVLGDELLAHVLDVHFRSAGLARLLFQAGQLVAALSDVAAHRDHLAAVVFLQPRNDDGGIQPARIGERHFLRFVHKSFGNSGVRSQKTESPFRLLTPDFCLLSITASAAAPSARAGGSPPGRKWRSARAPSRSR